MQSVKFEPGGFVFVVTLRKREQPNIGLFGVAPIAIASLLLVSVTIIVDKQV